jgi:hypothetical protein
MHQGVVYIGASLLSWVILSVVLTGFGVSSVKDIKNTITNPAFTEDGRSRKEWYVSGDRIEEQTISPGDTRGLGRLSGNPSYEYGEALGYIVNKVKSAHDKGRSYYDVTSINNIDLTVQDESMNRYVVIPRMKFRINKDFTGIPSEIAKKVVINISIQRIGQNSERTVQLRRQDLISAKPYITLTFSGVSVDKLKNLPIAIKYEPPPPSNKPGLLQQGFDELFRGGN